MERNLKLITHLDGIITLWLVPRRKWARLILTYKGLMRILYQLQLKYFDQWFRSVEVVKSVIYQARVVWEFDECIIINLNLSIKYFG